MKNLCFVFRAARVISTVCATAALAGMPLVSPVWAQGQGAAARTAESSVSRNVYVAGGQVRPGAAIEGDFIAVGGRVVLDQPVKGDATVAGGSVDLRAPVGDDVRAAGGDISIDSSVGGELFATGGNVTIGRAVRVGQGAQVYGGSVTVDGRIGGRLDVTAQKITLNGEVGGDARLVAEQIELGPTARIGGALAYVSASELKKAEGATIGGAVTREQGSGPEARWGGDRQWQMQASGPRWVASAFTFLALLACGAVFLLVFPVLATRASDTVRTSPWMALALGFAAMSAVPLLALLLFITLLGIPLGIVVMALYPVLLLAGYLVGVLFIARLAQGALRREASSRFAITIGFFALGLLLVMLVGRLPFVGGLALGVVTIAGTGACVLEIYRRRQAGSGGPAAPAAASASAPSGTAVSA